jgi:hypothetical protein
VKSNHLAQNRGDISESSGENGVNGIGENKHRGGRRRKTSSAA